MSEPPGTREQGSARQALNNTAESRDATQRPWPPMLVPLAYCVALVGGGVWLLWVDEQAWRLFRNATLHAWLQALMAIGSLVFLTLRVGLSSRTQRLLFWSLLTPPLLVALATVPGLFPVPGLIRSFGNTYSELDPGRTCRIFAQGFSKSLGLVVVGGTLTSALFSTGSMVLAVHGARRGAPDSRACNASIAAGLVGFALVAIACEVSGRGVATQPLAAAASLLGLVSVAVAHRWAKGPRPASGSHPAQGPRATGGPREAGAPHPTPPRAKSDGALFFVLLLALASLAAAVGAEQSFWLSRVFEYAWTEFVEPTLRQTLLASSAASLQPVPHWGLLYAAPVLLAFFVPSKRAFWWLFAGLRSEWRRLAGALLVAGIALTLPQIQLRALLPIVLDECAQHYPHALQGLSPDDLPTSLWPLLRSFTTFDLWR